MAHSVASWPVYCLAVAVDIAAAVGDKGSLVTGLKARAARLVLIVRGGLLVVRRARTVVLAVLVVGHGVGGGRGIWNSEGLR